MTRKLVTIRKISDLQPIENADKIETAVIDGWECVVKKGEFKKNDLCVYFEIDSLLPDSNPLFSFLAKGSSVKKIQIDHKEYSGYRLRTVKLRGKLSQGLALPLQTVFPEKRILELIDDPTNTMTLDLSEELGVVKYEMPIPAHLAGIVKGDFPTFLQKTDEERIQNAIHLLKEKGGTRIYITEKLDGSSVTFYKKDNEFGVCSRNLELKESDSNSMWQFAKEHELQKNLENNVTLQGEIIGPGIQKNPLKLSKIEVYIFNVYLIEQQRYLELDEMIEYCASLGLKTVPIVEKDIELPTDIKILLEKANEPSLIDPTVLREGIVVRARVESNIRINGNMSRFSFKVLSNEYLLNEE